MDLEIKAKLLHLIHSNGGLPSEEIPGIYATLRIIFGNNEANEFRKLSCELDNALYDRRQENYYLPKKFEEAKNTLLKFIQFEQF